MTDRAKRENGTADDTMRTAAACWLAGVLIAAAALLAVHLLAACSQAPEPAAPEPVPAETTAAPTTTTAPPPATTVPLAERCRQMGAEIADGLAAEARAIMDDGPDGLEQVAELRRRSTLGAFARTAGCEAGWSDGDEARYQALLAEAAEEPAGDSENGEEGPDTTAEEPAGEEPEPAAATTVAAATVTTEDPGPAPPTGTLDFPDETPAIPDNPAPDTQAAGPVTLSAPVPLGTWAEHLCPPEDVWAAGGFTSCGDYETGGDYLRADANSMRDCYHPPVRLGVGDRYISAAVTGTAVDGRRYVLETARTILGFSAPTKLDGTTPGPTDLWSVVVPLVRSTETYLFDTPDGGTERLSTQPPSTGPALRWVQVGGEDGRKLAADGTLASGLLAVNPGRSYDGSC